LRISVTASGGIGWLAGRRERHGHLVRLAPGAVVVHNAQLAHEVLAATNEPPRDTHGEVR